MVVVFVLKSWDWVRPLPPPRWDKIPTLTEFFLQAPLIFHIEADIYCVLYLILLVDIYEAIFNNRIQKYTIS